MRPVLFCHGAPGSPHDATLLSSWLDGAQVFAPDMLSLTSKDTSSGMIAEFDQLIEGHGNGKIDVAGFSIGAMVAIKIAAARSDQIGKLTLFSAAAPLQLGDFLPDMAGKPVFELALHRPRMLKFVTKAQGCFSSVAPNFLMRKLFEKCGDPEQMLLKDPNFCNAIRQGFQGSFRRNPDAYNQLLQEYASDWSEDIRQVSCPVALWHGEKDTWAPIAMAHALADAFTVKTKLNVLKDAEHYSTMVDAVN